MDVLFLFLYDYLSYESLTNGYVAAALLINLLKRIQNGFAQLAAIANESEGGSLLLQNPFEWSKWQTFNL